MTEEKNIPASTILSKNQIKYIVNNLKVIQSQKGIKEPKKYTSETGQIDYYNLWCLLITIVLFMSVMSSDTYKMSCFILHHYSV